MFAVDVVGDEQHVVGTEGDRTDRLDRRRSHQQTLITHGNTSCTTTLADHDLLDEVSIGAYAAPVECGRGRGRTGAKCETLSSMETMPAVVYVGDGAIEVQQVGGARARAGPACWSRCRTAASAAPTCTSCSSSTPARAPSSATSGRARSRRVGADVDGLGARRPRRARTRRRAAASAGRAARGRPSVCLRPPAARPPRLPRRVLAATWSCPPARLLRVPESLSTRAAALTEPTAIAHAHRQPRRASTPDDRVLVTGGGPVGLLITAVLHAQGIHDITVSEPAPLAARTGAARSGAARVIEPDELPRRADGPAGRRAVHASCSSARAAATRPSRRSTSSTTRARSCSSAPVTTLPRINHNRVIVLEHTIIGALQLRRRGFGARAGAARVGQAAARRAHRARRRAARRLLRRDAPARRAASCPAR